MELAGVLMIAAGAALALLLARRGPTADHERARRLIEGGTIRRA